LPWLATPRRRGFAQIAGMSIRSLDFASLALALLVPSLASAEEAPAMGKAGTAVIGTDITGVFLRSTSKIEVETPFGSLEDEATSTTFNLQPAIDYFVADRISVGLKLSYEYEKLDYDASDDEDRKETTLGVGIRGGVHLPLVPRFALWARGGVEYLTSEGEEGGGEEPEVSGFVFSADALVLLDIVPHLWIGAGPGFAYATADVGDVGTTKTTAFGFGLEVGGWF
jgi:hypothetical protein